MRVIVNEGTGAHAFELSAERTTVGAIPGSDVPIRHASAQGCQIVLLATACGHRVVRITGSVALNEAPVEVADLQNNDTLRFGDVMVLYKNAGARKPEPAREFELDDLIELEEKRDDPPAKSSRRAPGG